MNEELFNMELRKFLKTVGVTSQREIEEAVRKALAQGRVKPDATLAARMVLTIEAVGLNHTVAGDIRIG